MAAGGEATGVEGFHNAFNTLEAFRILEALVIQDALNLVEGTNCICFCLRFYLMKGSVLFQVFDYAPANDTCEHF